MMKNERLQRPRPSANTVLAMALGLTVALGLAGCGDGPGAPKNGHILVRNEHADSAALLVLTQEASTLADLNPSPSALANFAPLVAAAGGRIEVPTGSIDGYTPNAELVFVVYVKRDGRVALQQVIRLSANDLSRRRFRFGVADVLGAR